MILYKDIQAANRSAHKTDIKGKLYVPVAERVRAFRKVFPDGQIFVDVKNEGGVATARAEIRLPLYRIAPGVLPVDGMQTGTSEDVERLCQMILVATGTAMEKECAGNINRTSHVENAETSAVGRALGFCGFGIDTAIASADEVQNAELQDVSKQKVDGLKVKALTTRCAKDGVDVDKLLAVCKVKTFEDLTEKAFSNVWQNWDKVVALGGKHE